MKSNVNDRINFARRTKYSLMNSGYHGTNGLSPDLQDLCSPAPVTCIRARDSATQQDSYRFSGNIPKEQPKNHTIATENDSYCCSLPAHYENMFVQYAAISKSGKNDNFRMKIVIFIFAQNIDRGYTLEPPH